MKIYFAGGETPTHRSVLGAAGAKNYAINVTHLYSRMPKKAVYDLSKTVSAHVSVMIYIDPSDTDIDRYRDFIVDHGERAEYIIGPLEALEPCLDQFGHKLAPIWDGDLDALTEWSTAYSLLAVPAHLAEDTKLVKRLRGRAHSCNVSLVLMSSNAEAIATGRWEAVMASAWESVQRFGELQVWDGRTVKRYDTHHRDEGLKKHLVDINRLGVDVKLVQKFDKRETSKCAIRSWMELEKANSTGVVVTIPPNEAVGPIVDEVGNVIATTTPPPRNVELIRREPTILPGIKINVATTTRRKGDGDDELVTENRVAVDSSTTMLACNNCKLSSMCPEFLPNNSCAFNVPVEIQSKDQLDAVNRALLEMQFQRVVMAGFAEQMEGAGIDPVVSAEFERYLRLVEKVKDINDNRDYLNIDIKTKASAGMLSRLFGSEAGTAARQLPGAINTNELMAGIVDAEVIE